MNRSTIEYDEFRVINYNYQIKNCLLLCNRYRERCQRRNCIAIIMKGENNHVFRSVLRFIIWTNQGL